MKFVKKIEAVDAVRFMLSGNEKLDYFEEYPVFYDPDKETGIAYLRLATSNGLKRVDIGDWIVGSDKGVVGVYTSEAFRLLYESVNENFERNSEGFISVYKECMKELKEGGKKKMSASALVGEVEFKSGERFRLSLSIDRVEKEKKEPEKPKEEPKEKLKEEPKMESKEEIKKDGGA